MKKEEKLKTYCELCRNKLEDGICVNQLCKMGLPPYNEKQIEGQWVFFNR